MMIERTPEAFVTEKLSRRLAARLAFLRRPGVAAGGPARRWAAWARALARRFRAARPRGAGAALVLHRQAGQSAGVVERLVERTLVATALFAPRLHLTVAPLVRLEGRPGARSILPSTVLAGGVAAVAPDGVAARPADRKARVPQRDNARAPKPLALALARSGLAALPAGPALTLARSGRYLPQVSSAEPMALAGRVAARGRRLETSLPRPAATLHRPLPPAPPSEAAAESIARPRRRAAAGSSAAGAALSAAAPALLAGAPGELDRLTEQVVRRIDRRMAAWRERTGRVR